MTNRTISTASDKITSSDWLGHALLGAILGLICLRCVITESPISTQVTSHLNVYDLAYSLSMTWLLLAVIAMWCLHYIYHAKTAYAKTGIRLGLGLWLLAALVSTYFASDKRSAISDVFLLTCPIILCMVLVQLLNTPGKIRLVLITLGGLGILTSYECIDQHFITNQNAIRDYEANPSQMLNQIGQEAGTLNHFLFEHRLYSKGVKGFFTTRNSAGSFLLIAFISVLALWQERPAHSTEPTFKGIHLNIVFPILLIMLAFALFLTRSKAAIGSLVVFGLSVVSCKYYSPWFSKHRTPLLVLAGVIISLGILGLVQYGLSHDRLPGGNSMLVRWQYWLAAGQMIGDHPLTGVGPGNFANAYYHYKSAAAIESVSDPHNFILSLTSEYGLIGMCAFVIMLVGALKVSFVTPCVAECIPLKNTPENPYRLFLGYSIVIALCLLIGKPLISHIIGSKSIINTVSTLR